MPASTKQQYLDELAKYDNKKLLLWELAADGRDFVGVGSAAREHGKEDAPIPEQVNQRNRWVISSKGFAISSAREGEIVIGS